MMANSPLSLMQLQHKSEDTKGLHFQNFVNNISDQSPLTTVMSVNKIINNPVHGGGGPIKRKRGRPRKYTLGPFPTNPPMKISNSSSQSTGEKPRLSLPTQFAGNGDPFSPSSSAFSSTTQPMVQHTTVTDSLMKSVKHVKTKMTPKMSYPSMVPMPTPNGHSSISEKVNGGLDYQTNTSVASWNHLPTLPQIEAHTDQIPSSSSSSSSIFRYPAAPAIPASSTQEYTSSSTKLLNHVQVHQNHNLGNIYIPTRNSLPTITSSTSLPYFIDTFFQHTPVTSAPMSAVTASNNSINYETNLVGRLLPQAEAAICAAKAAGLSGPHTWTPEMVAAFVVTLPGCQGLAHTFIEHEIDGPALLCLEQHELMSIMKLKLGPAVKVFGAIRVLRKTMMSIPFTDLSADHASALAAAIICFPSVSSSSPSSPRIDKLNNKHHITQATLPKSHHLNQTSTNSAFMTKKLANQIPSAKAGTPAIGMDLTPSTVQSPCKTSSNASPNLPLVNGESINDDK